MCCKCNRRIEKEKPWLVQWRANTDYENTHDWSHTLVSIPDPDVSGEADGDEYSGTVTEKGLVDLHKKLDEKSAELTSRLVKVEELLSHLVNAAK